MTEVPLARAAATRLAIFLDFDGCLVDLAPRPQDVVVPRTLGPILHALHRKTKGALAIISGRPVAEIRAFLPGLHLPLCGSHGAERAVVGRRTDRMIVDQPAIDAAALRAKPLMTQPGLMLERKPVGLGLHYRGAPGRFADVQALAVELLSQLPDFHAHAGKMVIELRPDGIGKGHALQTMMTDPRFRGRAPVMFGDDATDEPAFAVAHRFGGMSVKIGAGETGARSRLACPAATRRLLASWADQRGIR